MDGFKKNVLLPNKMMCHRKTYWVFLFAVFLTVGLGACKNRGRDKTRSQEEVIGIRPDSAGVAVVTSLEQLNPANVNTCDYFLGEIDGQPYMLKLESATKTQIDGKFYPIDSTQSIASPTFFTILRNDSSYVLTFDKQSSPVKFAVTIDTAAISGTVTVLDERNREYRLAFNRHRAPLFREAKSTRYREPQSTFTKIPDIRYGKAKGFWTSYPIEDDTNYTKMILKLLPKTAASKKLDLFLDLYTPDDSLQKHPLIVLLHGGAFFFGDKGNRNMREWCEHFAKCGYVVASVNYRLGFAISKSSIQQCGYQAIQDAHAALRYLVANAEEYRIDPDYIFLAGTSAGSITALGAAFMTNENCPPFVAKHKLPKKCGSLHTSGNEYRDKVKIKAIANMWGAVYDLRELNSHRIPVVSFHGTNDKVVPFGHGFPFSGVKSKLGERMFDEMYGSQSIHRYLDSMHVRNKLYPLEGCGHAPYQERNGTLNEHYYFIQDKIQAFFYSELKSKANLKHDDHAPQLYCLDDDAVTNLSWQAEGGLILSVSGNSVRVVWLDDVPKHLLRASGINALGVPFKQEWNLRKACS